MGAPADTAAPRGSGPEPGAQTPSAGGTGPVLGGTGPVLGGTGLFRGGVERSAARRTDTEWLDAAWADPRTKVLVIENGHALARFADGAAGLVFVPPDRAPDGARFLLGIDADEVAYFGVGGALPDAGDGEDIRRAGLRDAGPLLSDLDAALLTHAVALANWHDVAAYCPRCGAATEPAMAGHSRRCVADASEHFPRSDPAVIMAVTDPDDRILLARNVQWPERRVSVLAGFVEPGESAEEAVAREVHEETGIVVGSVSYAGSQPWPMPHNLMLGFRAKALGTQIQADADEIAEAHWYSREDLRKCLLSGDLLMPPSVSISRWLIETWFGEPLPSPA